MHNNNNLKFIHFIAPLLVLLMAAGCSKEKSYHPAFPDGTKFSIINLSGFSIEDLDVHIGPEGKIAGNVFEVIQGKALAVPFAATQALNRVGFFKKDGTFMEGSQISFNTPGKDTSVKIFYDGKVFVKNPVFPVPALGKMGLRINFKSIATKYTAPVDLEFHEMKFVSKDTVVFDTVKNKLDTIQILKKVPNKNIAFVVSNVKNTEFTDYQEIPAPKGGYTDYAVYVNMHGTRTGLSYPAGTYIEYYFDVVPFIADQTSIISMSDIIITTERPRRLQYSIDDRTQYFQ